MKKKQEKILTTALVILFALFVLTVLTVITLMIMSAVNSRKTDATIEAADKIIEAYEEHNQRLLSPLEIREKIKIDYGNAVGSMYTFEGYFLIDCIGSEAFRWKETHAWIYDEEGFAKYHGRYIIACRSTFGNIGDEVSFVLKNGKVIDCIIGDFKADDPNVTDYGHVLNGFLNVVEFCVSEEWYDGSHDNPGTDSCHPDWRSPVMYAEVF